MILIETDTFKLDLRGYRKAWYFDSDLRDVFLQYQTVSRLPLLNHKTRVMLSNLLPPDSKGMVRLYKIINKKLILFSGTSFLVPCASFRFLRMDILNCFGPWFLVRLPDKEAPRFFELCIHDGISLYSSGTEIFGRHLWRTL